MERANRASEKAHHFASKLKNSNSRACIYVKRDTDKGKANTLFGVEGLSILISIPTNKQSISAVPRMLEVGHMVQVGTKVWADTSYLRKATYHWTVNQW